MARMFSTHTVAAGVLALAGTTVAACESEPEAVEQETRFQCGIERRDGRLGRTSRPIARRGAGQASRKWRSSSPAG